MPHGSRGSECSIANPIAVFEYVVQTLVPTYTLSQPPVFLLISCRTLCTSYVSYGNPLRKMDDSNESPLPPNHQRVPLIIIASVFSAFGSRYSSLVLRNPRLTLKSIALVVFARLYIRKFVLHSLGWDDYTIIIAWVGNPMLHVSHTSFC